MGRRAKRVAAAAGALLFVMVGTACQDWVQYGEAPR